MTPPDFTIIKWDILSVQICTSLDDEEATALLNKELPTGIENDWAPSTAEDEAPIGCDLNADTHRHILYHC